MASRQATAGRRSVAVPQSRAVAPSPAVAPSRAVVSSAFGMLVALFAVLFGVAVPGPAVAAPVVPLTSAAAAPAVPAAPAAGQSASGTGEGVAGHETAKPEAVLDQAEAAPPQLVRDTVPDRHVTHPGGAALSGFVDVPHPRPSLWLLADPPVADGDFLRGAPQLGRAPPASPGN